MISAPLVADLSRPGGSRRHGGRPGLTAAVDRPGRHRPDRLRAIGLAAWGIFLSPLGFTRYPLSDRDRTFTIHRPGTYVVYFEFPGESRSLLPPALDIGVAALSGQKVDVTIDQPAGARRVRPGPTGCAGHEGRAVALITSHEAGTFVVSITPTPATEVDTNSQRIVTQGTIALGREWSASWLASWGGVTLMVVVPIVAGVAVLVLAWQRRGPRHRPSPTSPDPSGRLPGARGRPPPIAALGRFGRR